MSVRFRLPEMIAPKDGWGSRENERRILLQAMGLGDALAHEQEMERRAEKAKRHQPESEVTWPCCLGVTLLVCKLIGVTLVFALCVRGLTVKAAEPCLCHAEEPCPHAHLLAQLERLEQQRAREETLAHLREKHHVPPAPPSPASHKAVRRRKRAATEEGHVRAASG